MNGKINEIYLLYRTQIMLIVVLAYQLYLAVSTEVVDSTLNEIQKVAQWPIQALNIGLFVLVLGICWLYLQSTRKDLMKLQQIHDDERKEYINSLKQLAVDMGKIIERNNVLNERVDRKLDQKTRGDS
jgi:hypothetical protein